jgi:hypothetical protein
MKAGDLPRSTSFYPPDHVDPSSHQALPRAGQGIDQIHEEESCIDSNVVVANCANGIHVRTVYGADIRMFRWENLHVPNQVKFVFARIEAPTSLGARILLGNSRRVRRIEWVGEIQ